MDVHAALELRLVLPVGESGIEPAEVSCRGRVVRTISPSEKQPRGATAVAIEQYDFLPPSAGFLSEATV